MARPDQLACSRCGCADPIPCPGGCTWDHRHPGVSRVCTACAGVTAAQVRAAAILWLRTIPKMQALVRVPIKDRGILKAYCVRRFLSIDTMRVPIGNLSLSGKRILSVLQYQNSKNLE